MNFEELCGSEIWPILGGRYRFYQKIWSDCCRVIGFSNESALWHHIWLHTQNRAALPYEVMYDDMQTTALARNALRKDWPHG